MSLTIEGLIAVLGYTLTVVSITSSVSYKIGYHMGYNQAKK